MSSESDNIVQSCDRKLEIYCQGGPWRRHNKDKKWNENKIARRQTGDMWHSFDDIDFWRLGCQILTNDDNNDYADDRAHYDHHLVDKERVIRGVRGTKVRSFRFINRYERM